VLRRLHRFSGKTVSASVVLAVGALLLAGCSSSSLPATPPASQGIVQNRAVPSIPMVNQNGVPTTLAAFRGKTVVLAPMLTLCQEVCPLTTQNLALMQRAVKQAGLSGKVAIVEYSVDPDRDTPARLAAYAKLAGADWTLLTGTQANVTAMNSFFYVEAQKVAEASPPQLDWWTHQPLTYDVNHSDGFFIIDPSGHERFATAATPDVTSHKLPAALNAMLDTQGEQNLNDPGINGQTWTVSQALSDLGWVVHQTIPAPS
jgi:cytochrome oxidase Cu insertion factor (SCO1/SenC/PrrC family)